MGKLSGVPLIWFYSVVRGIVKMTQEDIYKEKEKILRKALIKALQKLGKEIELDFEELAKPDKDQLISYSLGPARIRFALSSFYEEIARELQWKETLKNIKNNNSSKHESSKTS